MIHDSNTHYRKSCTPYEYHPCLVALENFQDKTMCEKNKKKKKGKILAIYKKEMSVCFLENVI